jgi:hypothetical protein
MPLEKISGGGDRDHNAGADVFTQAGSVRLDQGLGSRLGQLAQKLPPPPEERSQQARHRQYHVTVGHRSQQRLTQPLGPEELLLLFA